MEPDLQATASPDWRSSVRMSFDLHGLAAQRHRLVHELEQHAHPTETAYDAALVLGELVSNALQHGAPLVGGGLDVSWGAQGGLVHVEVTDGGAVTVPAAGAATRAATRGRGLAIVAALAASWGIRTEPSAMTVWAVLDADRSAT